MDTTWKLSLWQQFGASIDMLDNAMQACPDSLWNDRSRQPEFWYTAFHALFWLDLYLSDNPDEFTPPPPFSLEELDPAGILPPRVYTKDELSRYLAHGRNKCRTAIRSLTDEESRRDYVFGTLKLTRGELFLYNMRHVQHHAAQLNLMLRQTTGSAPSWVRKTQVGLEA